MAVFDNSTFQAPAFCMYGSKAKLEPDYSMLSNHVRMQITVVCIMQKKTFSAE